MVSADTVTSGGLAQKHQFINQIELTRAEVEKNKITLAEDIKPKALTHEILKIDLFYSCIISCGDCAVIFEIPERDPTDSFVSHQRCT